MFSLDLELDAGNLELVAVAVCFTICLLRPKEEDFDEDDYDRDDYADVK